MSLSYLVSGVDLLALPCITKADVQQAITMAQPRTVAASYATGFVVVSDTAPDVVTTPELANFIWLKSVSLVPIGEFYYYDGTTWVLLSVVDGNLLAANSVPLSKLSLLGALPYNIIQVDATGTALQYISIVNAIQNGSIPIVKLSNLGTLGAQNANNVVITGGSVNVTTLVGNTLNVATTANLNTIIAASSFNLFPTTVALAAADQIILTSPKIRISGNGGPVTLTATPTIAVPTFDAMLLLMGDANAAANPVTLQAETTLPGSGLRLGAATRVLGIYDTLLLVHDKDTGFWTEVAYTNNS